ncbi:low molecular weight phosphatase family protein [Bradyrhizobium canariense]|uniref:arsenate-mycothiol transferase ArsC n=1 Tax=Bradyrhizobium canariense TaxID=255045 RepID=UPI001CA551B9|nr:low molecular weight phosphatase family protein [Bradyrhizobium canariense]MBW5435810.1 low molecular weight phosphatase family protein [Bradyrhizobium canariense]
MLNKVLFLCTGNYYRSRFAEELFNHIAKLEGLEWHAFSRGVTDNGSSDNIGPMSRFARAGLHARGIVPQGAARDPQPCSLSDFDASRLVIALKEAEHRPLIERRFPEAADRVSYWHVDDIDCAEPSVALAIIDEHVRELVSRIRSLV